MSRLPMLFFAIFHSAVAIHSHASCISVTDAEIAALLSNEPLVAHQSTIDRVLQQVSTLHIQRADFAARVEQLITRQVDSVTCQLSATQFNRNGQRLVLLDPQTNSLRIAYQARNLPSRSIAAAN